MSFVEQERILFDLLFNQHVRADFAMDADAVLARYALDDNERQDFRTVRIAALELDASMRTQLLLGTISHAYPVTFSLVSALPHGLDLLRSLVDTETMRTPPFQRSTVYGQRLCRHLQSMVMPNESERATLLALAEMETGMAWTAALLKQHVASGGHWHDGQADLPEHWSSVPVKLAEFVSVAMLPLSYDKLKAQLAGKTADNTWSRISARPLTAARMARVLQPENPVLMVARAQLAHASACEPGILHQTLELAEGFAHLFQHINGNNSVDRMLQGFRQAGAPEAMLNSVRSGFRLLISGGMLTPA